MGSRRRGSEQTVGYRYYFGILMGLCRGPINGLNEIRVGSKRAWISRGGNVSFNLIADLRVPLQTRQFELGSGAIESFFQEVITEVPPGTITAAFIDINGDGTEEALTLGAQTTLTSSGTSIGTVQVSADGSFTSTQSPSYFGQFPRLRYIAQRNGVSYTRYYDIGGSLVGDAPIEIDAYNLFGGEEREGGVQGRFQLKIGTSDQTMVGSDYAAMRSGPLPGFRRMVTAFFDGIVTMGNPYPKPWEFRIWRTTAGWQNDNPWYPERATINIPVESPADFQFIRGMNAVHIMYESFTNKEWGRGLDPTAMDDAAWRAAADTIYAEGFGLCIRWSRKDTVDAFINGIKNHINAAIYTDRRTGLVSIKLVRGDYDINTLPLFTTESGIVSIEGGEISSTATAINHVQVKYRDPVTNEDRTVSVGNIAARLSAGGVVNSVTKEYPGVPVASLALRLAQRDLKVASASIRRFELVMDRRAYFIQPGSVIAVEDLKRGVPRMALRVGTVDNSNYRQGTIKIAAVQDIFSTPATSFSAVVPPTWQGPSNRPCIGSQKAFEVPYFMLARSMTPSELDYVLDDVGYLATMSSVGSNPMNAGYEIHVRESAPTPDDEAQSNDYICT